MTKDKALIAEVHERSGNKSTPVLLKFQNGGLKNAHKETTLYFPAKEGKSINRAVVIASGNVYTGPIANGNQELVDTYICVRNKTTDKVRIIPIDQVKLVNHVHEDRVKTVFSTLSKEDAIETAMRNFGGRKVLRYLNNREREKVSIDVIKDQLEKTVQNAEVSEQNETVVSTEEIANRIRPPCNKEATNLHDVYDIADIIPLELLERLDEEVATLLTTDIDDIPIPSEYLKKAIQSLKGAPQSTHNILQMKIIIYMDALITLIKSKQKNLSRIEFSQITEKVENDIRNRFSAENSLQKVRSSTTNEKAICYFLVLAFLISEEFELDLVTLSTELCMSKVKILKYGNLVNAVHRSKTDCLKMVLPSQVKPMGFAYVGKRKRQ